MIMRFLYFIICLLFIGRVFPYNDQWIDLVIELTINNKFNRAITIIQEQINTQPDDYKAYFYLAATYQAKMTHYENLNDGQLFNSAINKTIDIVESKLKSDKVISDSLQADLFFYLGSAYGYRASFQGETGKWYKAIGSGRKAKKYLDRTITTDSTFYDAYLGIGTYKYWLSSKTKFLIWLPFIGDGRDEGIELIKKAIDNNCRSKYMAMHQLIFILLNYEKYTEAIPYAELVKEKFPESEFMWMAVAHTYYKNNDFKKAEPAYVKLLQLAASGEEPNSSHIVKYRYKLVYIYFEQERYSECYKECKKVIALSDNKLLSKKAKNDLEKTRDILEKCRKEMDAKGLPIQSQP